MVFWTTPGINADYMKATPDGRVCRVSSPVEDKIAPKIDNTNAPKRGMGNAENNPDQVSAAGSGKTPAKGCNGGNPFKL